MSRTTELTPAKRKRLLQTYGPLPSGYTHEDLHTFLDLFYGLFSHCYTQTELRHLHVCDPFDRSETPRRLAVVELAQWLEALLL